MQINWQKHGIDVTQIRGGKGFCPKCHDTRKNKRDRSLSVDVQNGLFKCHNAGCDFEGTAIEYQPKKEYVKPQPKLQKVSDKVLKYFEDRGISNNTLLAFGITEANEWMPQDNKETKVICFNYYRGEDLINIKYRSAVKGFKMVSGAELIFYNLNALNNRTEIVITEGEFDCLTYWECGISNVISVPNGASIGKNAKLEYLDNCYQHFEGIEKIVISVDNDEAGLSLQKELIRRLGSERCYTVSYPDGCKDANEVLIKHGKDAVRALYENSEPLPVEGVDTVVDRLAELRRLYKEGYPKTLKLSKFNALNQYMSWKLGELTTITGIPNHGKSTWLNNILVSLASEHGWKFATFTPEKAPSEMFFAELCQIYTGKPFYRKDEAVKMNETEFLDALNFVDAHFYNLKVDEVNLTIDGLLDKVREMILRYGVNSFLLDPWNYLEHKREVTQSETEYIGECLTKIANFSKKYQIHTFVVAHPTKQQKDKDGKYAVPDMYSISGSANFNNKTDNGISVYRDFDNGVTRIYVQKVRWFYVGSVGNVEMKFDVQSQRFNEAGDEQTAYLGNLKPIVIDNPQAGIKPYGNEPFD